MQLQTTQKLDMRIGPLREAILSGAITLEEVVERIYANIEAFHDHNVWIYLLTKEEALKKVEILKRLSDKNLPLFGIPYAVKDNIDVAGVPTTAACEKFSYLPRESADVVNALEEAGALFIGKTNLDQFATGLVGTRSPYGVVKNSFNPEYIAGGSSAGSAVAVSLGMVSFSLGTDTAGSGRVPAGFNNIFGLKPTKNVVSTKGVVPACKSLDCVSFFTLSAEDASVLFSIASASLSESRVPRSFTYGVPKKEQLNFFGSTEYEMLFYEGLQKLNSAGGRQVDIDFSFFIETASLLYDGPWVAERLASIKDFFESNSHDMLPETRTIIEGAKKYSAVDTFLALYKLEDLKAKVSVILKGVDLLVVPTAPTIYTIEDIAKEPFLFNKNLGYYTNFVNLLDLCALAVPNGFQRNGLPMGITMIARAYEEQKLLQFGKLFSR